MDQDIFIYCPFCLHKVKAKIIGVKSYGDSEFDLPFDSEDYLFVECSICHNVMVGISRFGPIDPFEWDYEPAKLLWPAPKIYLDEYIPPKVRDSIKEANACYYAAAYKGCVAMCRLSLQEICENLSIKANNLSDELKELKEKNIIDEKTY